MKLRNRKVASLVLQTLSTLGVLSTGCVADEYDDVDVELAEAAATVSGIVCECKTTEWIKVKPSNQTLDDAVYDYVNGYRCQSRNATIHFEYDESACGSHTNGRTYLDLDDRRLHTIQFCNSAPGDVDGRLNYLPRSSRIKPPSR